RTTYQHLQRYWYSRARLLPPYAALDLSEFTHWATPPEEYRPLAPSRLAALERKLNAFRWALWAIFPRGFAFLLGERCLRYDALRGRLRDADAASGERGDFVVTVPKLTMKEALRNNHVSDLGITMFARIRLLRRLDPRKVYALFVLFQFDDYG